MSKLFPKSAAEVSDIVDEIVEQAQGIMGEYEYCSHGYHERIRDAEARISVLKQKLQGLSR